VPTGGGPGSGPQQGRGAASLSSLSSGSGMTTASGLSGSVSGSGSVSATVPRSHNVPPAALRHLAVQQHQMPTQGQMPSQMQSQKYHSQHNPQQQQQQQQQQLAPQSHQAHAAATTSASGAAISMPRAPGALEQYDHHAMLALCFPINHRYILTTTGALGFPFVLWTTGRTAYPIAAGIVPIPTANGGNKPPTAAATTTDHAAATSGATATGAVAATASDTAAVAPAVAPAAAATATLEGESSAVAPAPFRRRRPMTPRRATMIVPAILRSLVSLAKNPCFSANAYHVEVQVNLAAVAERLSGKPETAEAAGPDGPAALAPTPTTTTTTKIEPRDDSNDAAMDTGAGGSMGQSAAPPLEGALVATYRVPVIADSFRRSVRVYHGNSLLSERVDVGISRTRCGTAKFDSAALGGALEDAIAALASQDAEPGGMCARRKCVCSFLKKKNLQN
jgi:hypothetical protein